MFDYVNYKGFMEAGADRSPVMNDTNQNYTKALFIEWREEDVQPLYTLKDQEWQGLPSMYQIYINSTDEYEACMKLVGSVRHWEKLCGSKWFMEGIGAPAGHRGLKAWREDMILRDRSRAKAMIMQEAENGSVTAQKILLELGGTKTQTQKDRAAKNTTERSNGDTGKLLSIIRGGNG